MSINRRTIQISVLERKPFPVLIRSGTFALNKATNLILNELFYFWFLALSNKNINLQINLVLDDLGHKASLQVLPDEFIFGLLVNFVKEFQVHATKM